jgi:NDP-sugar pyrophosphorylase family protein
MNIIFPVAGFGERFKKQGFSVPKPLVKVKNKCLIEYAVESLNLEGHYFFVTRQLSEEHNDQLKEIFDKLKIKYTHIKIDFATKGAAETALIAAKQIKNLDEQLIITNCDQYTPWDSNKFLRYIEDTDYDAIVTLYDHKDVILNEKSKYSFVQMDENNQYAIKFAEKLAISYNSLNGIHYWKNVKDFIKSATDLLETQINSEYYISLTFNKLIENRKKIGVYKMAQNEFFSLGSPEEIEINLQHI